MIGIVRIVFLCSCIVVLGAMSVIKFRESFSPLRFTGEIVLLTVVLAIGLVASFQLDQWSGGLSPWTRALLGAFTGLVVFLASGVLSWKALRKGRNQ